MEVRWLEESPFCARLSSKTSEGAAFCLVETVDLAILSLDVRMECHGLMAQR